MVTTPPTNIDNVEVRELKAKVADQEREILALQVRVASLTGKLAEMDAYADRLAAGLPDGMLPKDVENIRNANAVMATQVETLEAELADENAKLRAQVDILGGMFDKLKAQVAEMQSSISSLRLALWDIATEFQEDSAGLSYLDTKELLPETRDLLVEEKNKRE